MKKIKLVSIVLLVLLVFSFVSVSYASDDAVDDMLIQDSADYPSYFEEACDLVPEPEHTIEAQEVEVVEVESAESDDNSAYAFEASEKLNSNFTSRKPAKVRATRYAYDSLVLTWNKFSGANGYLIYRSTEKNGNYARIKKITSVNTLSYIDTGLKTGKAYYYKLVAYKTVYGNTYRSLSSAITGATPVLAMPRNLKASQYGSGRVWLDFYGVSGAKTYEIWRYDNGAGVYKKAFSIDSTSTGLISCLDYDLKPNMTYHYKVISFNGNIRGLTAGPVSVYVGY